MARSLTAAATTEAEKQAGAFPRRILEVQWSDGTKYYSTEDLSSPVSAEGRLLRIGEITIQGKPGKGAAVRTLDVTFADEDFFLKAKNEAKPGIQTTPAILWIWFEGTTWPDDRVAEFGGIITAPLRFQERNTAWRLTLKGFEHHHDKQIGEIATKDIFPEIRCTEVENELIPIAYGNPCYRIPAYVIDRPGEGTLASQLEIPDSTLKINSTASEANFTTGYSIDLAVGAGNRWEKITGSFADDTTDTFDITDRGSIEASGTTDGIATAEGFEWILIPEGDFTDATINRSGRPLYIKDNDGVWHTLPVTHWTQDGTSRRAALKGDLNLSSVQNDYKIGAIAGWVPLYPPGTQVREIGSWKYVTNFLPSESVERVEIKGTVEVPGGDRRTAWLEINPAHYSTDLNDQSFNTNMGRAADDDGMTTVSLDFTPTQFGTDDPTIYVTVKGIKGGGTTALENPADVIKHLLENQFLGNVPSGRINGSSFNTGDFSQKFSFALLDSGKSLNDLTSELAHQANAILFWDGQQVNLKKLERPLQSADSELTITRDDYSLNEPFKIEDADIKHFVTELQSKFRPTVTAAEQILTRESSDGKDDFGIQREKWNLWSYQFPTSVALATEFWLQYLLETNRRVTVTTYLQALKIQPGDVITLDIDDGDGTIIFDSVLAQVIEVRRSAAQRSGMEQTRLTCELKLYDYTIETGTPSDTGCIGDEQGRILEDEGKLYLQSDGTDRSLFVAQGPRGGDGAGNLTKPVQSDMDPSGNVVIPQTNLLGYIQRPPC